MIRIDQIFSSRRPIVTAQLSWSSDQQHAHMLLLVYFFLATKEVGGYSLHSFLVCVCCHERLCYLSKQQACLPTRCFQLLAARMAGRAFVCGLEVLMLYNFPCPSFSSSSSLLFLRERKGKQREGTSQFIYLCTVLPTKTSAYYMLSATTTARFLERVML